MPRKEANIKSFFISNHLNKDNFQWTPEELQAVEDKDIDALMAIAHKRITSNLPDGKELIGFWGNIHNMDKKKKWDTATNQFIEVDVEPHFNMVGFIQDNVTAKKAIGGIKASELSEWLGIKEAQIEKPKSKYSRDNFLSYLMHAKDSHKALYNPDDVVTMEGQTYKDIYEERKEEWDKGRAIKTKQKAQHDIDWLEEQCAHGKITKKDIDRSDELYEIYFPYNHQARINAAIKAYGARKAQLNYDALMNGEFEQICFYVEGEPGSGKTKLAEHAAYELEKWAAETLGQSWSTYNARSKNAFDGYNGEEIVIMQDASYRPFSGGIESQGANWLNLLDPTYALEASCRYKDILVVPRVVIITNANSILDYFYTSTHDMTLDQYLRRFPRVIKSEAPPLLPDYDENTEYRKEEEKYDYSAPHFKMSKPIKLPDEETKKLCVRDLEKIKPYNIIHTLSRWDLVYLDGMDYFETRLYNHDEVISDVIEIVDKRTQKNDTDDSNE